MNPFSNREGMSILPPDEEESVRVQYLIRKGKLVKTGLTIDEVAARMHRASGLCICTECGEDYYSHPYVHECRDDEGSPFLHIICNGDIVKL